MADDKKMERMDRIPAEGEDVTLNQDGSRLGGGGGGQVANPTAESATRDLPIGGSTGTWRELGQRREEIPGFAGAESAGDKGSHGWVGGDPSGHGTSETDQTTEGPRFDR